MLVTSIFSFFHNVFYPSKIKFQFFSHIYFVVCKCFQFGPVLRICRLVKSEVKAFLKHCGKGGKCWSPAFSPLPTMFFFLLFEVISNHLSHIYFCPRKIHSVWTCLKSCFNWSRVYYAIRKIYPVLNFGIHIQSNFGCLNTFGTG